jgi:ABC-type sugar transport system permease subunit
MSKVATPVERKQLPVLSGSWLRIRYHQRLALSGFTFTVPVLIFFLIFSVYPMLSAFYYSLTQYNLVSPPTFVGLDNYRALLTDYNFKRAVGVTLRYTLYFSPLCLVISFCIASLLKDDFRGRDFFRLLFFAPCVLSTIGLATAWRIMLGLNGAVNAALGVRIPWLTDTRYALWGIIMMALWQQMGYYVMISLVGLQSIPREYYEAAKVDGAGGVAVLRWITLPLMRPTFALLAIITIIQCVKVFTPMYIMTSGGPSFSTRPAVMLIYQNAFSFWKMGMASAMSVVLFVAMLVLTVFQVRLFRVGREV